MRSVFPSHSELVILVNSVDSSFTGTSGSMAWEVEGQGLHLIVMWSVPYNLNIYSSYFGVAVVRLSRGSLSRDMLPYWYTQIIKFQRGGGWQRKEGGESLVYKQEDFFVIAHMDKGYHPQLNIRYK